MKFNISKKGVLTSPDIEVVNMSNENIKNRVFFGKELPDTIVMHYTAGGNSYNSAKWLLEYSVKASAHVIISRKGVIYQITNFKYISWHAGKSFWVERKNMNKYSIGIELSNYGILNYDSFKNAYYKVFENGKKIEIYRGNVYCDKKVDEKGEDISTYWENYPDDQIETTFYFVKYLKEKYNINLLLGHSDISPKRKIDPGPAFPMRLFKTRLFNDINTD